MQKLSQNPKYFIYRDMIGLNAWIKHKYKTKPQEFIPIGKVIDETYNLIITSKMDNPEDYHQDKKKYIKENKDLSLLVWKLDRLSRNPVDGGNLIWLLDTEAIKEIRTYEKTYKN